MTLTFTQERWQDAWPDIEPLHRLHWGEVEPSPFDLDVDSDRMGILDNAGCLLVVTARDEGKLVGYFGAFISHHLHYRSILMAITDFYYVVPSYRKGRTGIKLIRAMEDALVAKGVKQLFIHTKAEDGLDHSRILEFMDYKFVEKTFVKTLGS